MAGSVAVPKHGDPNQGWDNFLDELQPLCTLVSCDQCQSGDISARSRKARDQPGTNGISSLGHDDRDFERRLLCRQSGGCEPRDDYIDFETDQLGGQFGKPVEVSFSGSKLKSNVLPLDITQIAQSLPELPPKLFRADIANNQLILAEQSEWMD